MNIPQNNILETNISDLFGFESLTDEEKAELLDTVGNTIIESTMLRYATTVDEAEAEKFDVFMEAHAEDADVLEKLLDTFPQFSELLVEEIAAFKKEASEVLKP